MGKYDVNDIILLRRCGLDENRDEAQKRKERNH